MKLQENCITVKVEHTFTKPKEAIKHLEENTIDLVFLDVEMPEINGFEVLDKIQNKNFEIVFVTAYNHYAIEAIRNQAFDYLEKPVSVEALKSCIEKLETKLSSKNIDSNQNIIELLNNIKNLTSFEKKLSLHTIDGIELVNLDDVTWVESLSNYTKFYLTNKRNITVSKTMGEFEEKLLKNSFYRIHRGAIVNLNYIKKIIKEDGGYVILQDDTKIEISNRRKRDFFNKIDNLFNE